MNRFTALLIALALIAGTAGCPAEPAPDPGPAVRYELTIASTGGGSVTTPGEGAFTHDAGTVVSLVASPDSAYRFTNWTGDVGTIADVTAASTAITMSGDCSITANFLKQYSLTISSTTGGSVTVPGEGTFAFDEGEVVYLLAEPEDGYHFVGWTGGAAPIADVTSVSTNVVVTDNYAIVAGFATDLYFWTDVYLSLRGSATSSPEARDPCLLLGIMTNMVVDSIRVDMPDGRSVIVPAYSDMFSPGVDWTELFRFQTCDPGMPLAGGEYVFTALNAAGEPVPGARNADIWIGVDPPNPPTNVRGEVVEDGILVSWDESPIIPGSFDPAAEPPLGFYELWIVRIDKREDESIYGTSGIFAPSCLVPQDKTEFTEGQDWGLSLGEMEDGTYLLSVNAHSMAPPGSLGKGFEYCNFDPGQSIVFAIEDGEITLKQSAL